MDEKNEQLINDLEEFASDSDMNETGIYTEILDLIHRQKAEIERLTEELDEATNSLVTASRCFTRMETFYKDKCKEFEIAKEKDTADSKQHCEKCRTYWLSKLDAQKERTSELQKQVDKLENRFENKACCNMSENCSMIQQTVKDTAKEILTELKNTRFHKGTLTYDFEMEVNRLAEKYGIDL